MFIALITSLVRGMRRRSGIRLRAQMALVPSDELAKAGLARTLSGSARFPFAR
ncbi:hypothetical protein [Phreatobacter sp.]|uniref:hypothetical protein n=1 Tax=Phreatobacter sp. TaxID=1966341 RepID=UPI003F726DE4